MELSEIAKHLVNPPKGILAADESTTSCCKRFEAVNIPCEEEDRRKYRELLITTQNTENYLTGIIMVDETLRQKDSSGKLFTEILKEKGILSGIKVDLGLEDFGTNGEQITKGLDGLDARLAEYASLGAKFAKWRAVFSAESGFPTDELVHKANSIMVEYASLCQKNNIVPIMEPEILMDGVHKAQDVKMTLEKILKDLFQKCRDSGIEIEGVILKTAMVESNKDDTNSTTPAEVATWTVDALRNTVPENIGGVVYLSGGMQSDEAIENFKAIMAKGQDLPFKMTFSFSRAIQNPVLEEYAKGNIEKAKENYLERLQKLSK